jgi:hypothetical protein
MNRVHGAARGMENVGGRSRHKCLMNRVQGAARGEENVGARARRKWVMMNGVQGARGGREQMQDEDGLQIHCLQSVIPIESDNRVRKYEELEEYERVTTKQRTERC